ncbi:uncharacterized protein G2W53_042942 [Senna tora]|uniref:Uncharacterized protein n=1 Tax=Senna tora TaxID=362788 RepID=A0A834SI31_9FABA|nr:uncharacterized protein G2W53_042942 [Senna tora]
MRSQPSKASEGHNGPTFLVLSTSCSRDTGPTSSPPILHVR